MYYCSLRYGNADGVYHSKIISSIAVPFNHNYYTMTIYVGNLNYKAAENQLTELFAGFGEVKSVKIIKDNQSGRSKGFAFVEMDSEESANKAIQALHETEFLGRSIIVNKARPKTNA